MSIRLLPGQKPKRTRHRVSTAIGAVIEPLSENFVFPGAPVSASGEADGASALTGGALRVVLPAGAAAGTSSIAGAAIRWEDVTDVLTGTSDLAGQADFIASATGTLAGAGSTLVGIPTMRIFAPAWGNSSLTGDARASYLVEALTVSQALVTGLGGYV